jgi:NDP-sugar pyrophosphorylase family protein
MRVVLFCGGLGFRLREHAEPLSKPMVSVGYRPILWHGMKYYAHYGYKDFILRPEIFDHSLFERGPAPWAVWANPAPDLRFDPIPSERIPT